MPLTFKMTLVNHQVVSIDGEDGGILTANYEQDIQMLVSLWFLLKGIVSYMYGNFCGGDYFVVVQYKS